MGCSWAVVDKANVAGDTCAGRIFACPWWACRMLKREGKNKQQTKPLIHLLLMLLPSARQMAGLISSAGSLKHATRRKK